MSERKIIDVRFGCEETERDEYSVTMTSSCIFKDEYHNLIENVIDITVDKEDKAICFYNDQTDSLIILHPEQVNHLKTILSEMMEEINSFDEELLPKTKDLFQQTIEGIFSDEEKKNDEKRCNISYFSCWYG